ncbi:MAG: DUF4402 domain-containing protein [Geothrix sp.]|nr:DUF4402 domain-containing protein [Geothrix sp.]
MHAASRLLAGALLLAGPVAFAQASATAINVPATARIYKPITLANDTGLSFGDIFASATAGTVTLAPASTRTATGGATLAATGTANAAQFTVGGKRNASYAITFSSPVVLSGSGADMAVSAFTPSLGSGLLDATGAQIFTVGATLAVGANQLDGDYAGTFSVTVTYN